MAKRNTRNTRSMKDVSYEDEFADEKIINKIVETKHRLKCKNEKQKEFSRLITEKEIIIAAGPAGVGKAQPLYSKILTPTGWVTMGDIKVGDEIIGSNGNVINVTQIHPQGEKEIYRVHFSDDSHTDCCDEHLWLTQTYYDRNYRTKEKGVRNYNPREGSVKKLSEIMGTLVTTRGDKNHTIPMVKPVNFTKQEFFIDPYIMGCLLGDGGLTQNRITFTTTDYEMVEEISNKLNEGHTINKKTGKYTYSIIGENRRNLILDELNNLKLKNVKTEGKYIPNVYKFNSVDVRLEMLKGLMDTDGYVNKKGTSVFFTNTSKQLIDDVCFIVNSLGGVYKLNEKIGKYKNYKGEVIECSKAYTLTISLPPNINPFKLNRKTDIVKPKSRYTPKRYITSIESIGLKEAQCITVDSDDSLYVTDDFIVTHNSYVAIARALELVQNKTTPYEKIVISKPIESAGENYGHLPGPQPLYAKILTPNGWTTMGELKIGDEIITASGKITNITGIFPKGVKDIYKIETSNNGVTYACEDHLWSTKTYQEHKHGKDFKTRTTKELSDTLINPNSGPKLNHYLPKSGVVDFYENDLVIPPYTLGVLLGDGHLGNSVSITNHKDDYEIIMRVKEELPNMIVNNMKNTISYNITSNIVNNKPAKSLVLENIISGGKEIYNRIGEAIEDIKDIDKSTLNYRCKNNLINSGIKYSFIEDAENWSNPIKNELDKLGLLFKLSYEKFIPNIYKYNTKENRVALLQGLMDTDGTIKNSTREVSYTTTSEKLKNDVIELCRSLGLNATYHIRDRVGKESNHMGRMIHTRRITYEISIPKLEEYDFNIFYLNRKQNKERLGSKNKHVKIKSITLCDKSEVQCIMVEDPSHLYITNDFIVTHNTLEEKMEPVIASSIDILDKIIGKPKRLQLQESDIIQVEPLGFLRGKTIDDSILVMEEVQNMSPGQVKTLLTRIGKNTKFILSGDLDQSDKYKNVQDSGLYDAMMKHRNIDEIGFFEFGIEDIVRNPIITKILRNYITAGNDIYAAKIEAKHAKKEEEPKPIFDKTTLNGQQKQRVKKKPTLLRKIKIYFKRKFRI